MATLINQSNTSRVYLSWQYGEFARSTSGGDNNYSMFSPSNYGEEGLWVTPIAICKSQSENLAIGLKNIFMSYNNGNSWASISNFTDGGNFKVVAIAPSDPNYIYAAKDNVVYYTWDGGNNWQTLNNQYVTPITDIVVSETNPLDVYFLKSSSYTRVYHSTDGALTVDLIQGSLTQTSSSAIAIEDNENHGIYIGTDFGIYYTNDLIDSWIFYSEQLPNVKITDLEIVNNKLRAATYGRGIWESDLYTTSVNIKKTKFYKSLVVFPNPAKENITIKSNELIINNIKIYNISGVLVKEFSDIQNTYSISNLVSGIYFIKVISNKEQFVKRFVKE